MTKTLEPYSLSDEKNQLTASRWAADLIGELRDFYCMANNLDIWNMVASNFNDDEWRKNHNIDGGPAGMPKHQWPSFFGHVLLEVKIQVEAP